MPWSGREGGAGGKQWEEGSESLPAGWGRRMAGRRTQRGGGLRPRSGPTPRALLPLGGVLTARALWPLGCGEGFPQGRGIFHIHEKNEGNCSKITQRTLKTCLYGPILFNRQFDGGVFDWVSENFLFFLEKLDLFIF